MSIKNSTLYLASFKSDSYYRTVCVDFSPLPTVDHGRISIMPEFNQDGQFYTKAFYSPYQKFLEIKKAGGDKEVQVQRQRQIFMKKIQESVSPQLNETPRFDPEDDHYCSICYQCFKCYWKHVNSQTHRHNIKSSQANSYIHDICQKYMKKTRSRKIGKAQKKNQNRTSDILLKKKLKQKKTLEKNTMCDFQYKPEDFIIKLPFNLLSKEKEQQQNQTVNFSTCINSTE